MTAKKADDYQNLSAELDEVLAKLQQPDVPVDEAVDLYERGAKLVAQLEKRVEQAENRIEQIDLVGGE